MKHCLFLEMWSGIAVKIGILLLGDYNDNVCF